MSFYRKRPIVIEAVRFSKIEGGIAWLADNSGMPGWLHDAWFIQPDTPTMPPPGRITVVNGALAIGTLEGPLTVSPGDWIIRGVEGEIYPCKDSVFVATYTPERAGLAGADETGGDDAN